MWIQERKAKNGDIKYRFMEQYKEPLTGKNKIISVTYDKNTTRSQKAASDELKKKIEEIMNKPNIINELAPNDITLQQLVTKYLEFQFIDDNGIKKATYSRNMHACNGFIRILGADTKVAKLNQNYVADMFRETGEGNGTLNERLTRFRALIRWGYKKDYISDISWLDKLDRFKDKPRRLKIEDKFLEADEVRKLIAGMEVDRWRLLTEFMVLSGLRVGEAVALTNDDVDIENSTIHVNTTYDPVNGLFTTPKSGETREVYIQPELAEVCKRIKKLMSEQQVKNGYGKSDFFFTNEKGRNIEYFAFNKYLKSKSNKILGRNITSHFLRHTSASLLMEAGINVDNISQRLGHADSKITREIYLHITEKLKDKYNQQIAGVNIISGYNNADSTRQAVPDADTKKAVDAGEYSMQKVTIDDLRRMNDCEGLILQGCCGDMNEWVTGINDILTKEGILLNGDTFKNISSFKHGANSNLLFSMDSVDLNIGKLAMWRLKTHADFGGTWLSDFVPNRLGSFIEQSVSHELNDYLLEQDKDFAEDLDANQNQSMVMM